MGLILSLASWTKGELSVWASTVVCIWSLLVPGSEHPYLWLRVFLPGPLFYKVGTDKVLGLGRNFVEVQNAPPAALGSSVRATHLLSPSPYRPTGKHPWTSHERELHPQERATETHPEVYRWEEEKVVSSCGPTSSSVNSENQIAAVPHILVRRILSRGSDR